MDGWWAEAYSPEVGWALGDGQEHGEDPAWDAVEADALYGLLESEVIPEFYTRDESGIPTAWVNRMRESMARLTPRFSADRAVREYAERHYLPAAAAYRERSADGGAAGRRIADWKHALDDGWDSLRFGGMRVDSDAKRHVFETELFLGDVDPSYLRVELYADGIDGGEPARTEMMRVLPISGDSRNGVYRASVSAARPAGDYTARVVPNLPGASVPLECAKILWQR